MLARGTASATQAVASSAARTTAVRMLPTQLGNRAQRCFDVVLPRQRRCWHHQQNERELGGGEADFARKIGKDGQQTIRLWNRQNLCDLGVGQDSTVACSTISSLSGLIEADIITLQTDSFKRHCNIMQMLLNDAPAWIPDGPTFAHKKVGSSNLTRLSGPKLAKGNVSAPNSIGTEAPTRVPPVKSNLTSMKRDPPNHRSRRTGRRPSTGNLALP